MIRPGVSENPALCPNHKRFLAKVEKCAPDECWPWLGARTAAGGAGYGQIRHRGRLLLAHRVAWILTNGPVPTGLCVLHKCDNPACCNLAHLFLGTHAENIADMVEKGRQARGQRNGSHKLTADQVCEIRRVFIRGSQTFGAASLGHSYGVSEVNILNIIAGRTWRHLLEVSPDQ